MAVEPSGYSGCVLEAGWFPRRLPVTRGRAAAGTECHDQHPNTLGRWVVFFLLPVF